MKIQKIIQGADSLSLGISIVSAVAIGGAMGYALDNIFDQTWILWVGLAWGIGAAIFNVYQVAKRHGRELEKFAKENQGKEFMKPKEDDVSDD